MRIHEIRHCLEILSVSGLLVASDPTLEVGWVERNHASGVNQALTSGVNQALTSSVDSTQLSIRVACWELEGQKSTRATDCLLPVKFDSNA